MEEIMEISSELSLQIISILSKGSLSDNITELCNKNSVPRITNDDSRNKYNLSFKFTFPNK